jgi:type I restriction enzyme S subunit
MEDLGIRQPSIAARQTFPLSEVYGGYTYFADGDVLLAKITPCFQNGKLGIARNLTNGVGFGSTEFFVLRCTNHIVPEYLFYFLWRESFIQHGVERMGGAVGQQRVPPEYVAEQTIPLPPLAEQKRIVGVLDAAFAAIDRAEANTRRNLANARELFESHLNGVFSRNGDGWTEKPLVEFGIEVSTGPFGSLLHKSDYVDDGTPLVNPINIEGDAIVPDMRKAVGKKKLAALSPYVLNENDIVIGRRGEIGRCAVVTQAESGWLCGTGCFVIRRSPAVNPRFLCHLLRSRRYREALERQAGRATMPSLSNTQLSSLRVALPAMREQDAIETKIEALQTERERLESLCTRKLSLLSALRQSLLHKAFAGELTVAGASA